ncbi:hypothetical protein F0P96_17930 [Hymenobacter busanensis]|uniref:Uncharacterized protein n=1 Tax=Hymenobacter busanensis TaxID=2607656 RepID=A0A7L4ZRP4_9BACT|nr:hypothetical protein [Hymenobacter busanensis]KAA9327119.1 hypothetical protein F0P96_17930 [Hymenobacter busanensis]QHJ05784.1 hypothetical protein GUY19_00130 [Hymenobacter busanensis]
MRNVGAALLLGWLLIGAVAPAAAQLSARKHTKPPAAVTLPAAPSTWRNVPQVAAPHAPTMSRQDRAAYEHCPDPQRYARKHRKPKMVRIF